MRKLKATKSVLCLSVALAMKDKEFEAETLYKDEVRSIDTYSKTSLIHIPKIQATLLSRQLNQGKTY